MTFDPASLFASGEAGAWYDPSDLSTLCQDTAGTIAVTSTGQSVARINDKSGRSKHLTQATAARRPTYQVDESGSAYLLFDGANDAMSNTSLAMSLPFDRVSAICQIGWTLNDSIFGSHTGYNCILYQSIAQPELRITAGGAAVIKTNALPLGKNGIVTERHVAGASKLAINNGAYVSGDIGSTAPTALTVGATSDNGTGASNFRFYGMVTRSQMTDDEIADVRAWLAGRANITLRSRNAARHSCWV